MDFLLKARHANYKQFLAVQEVGNKKLVQNILSTQPIDLNQLKEFTLKNSLPSDYRSLVWKLLLHITPRFTESQEFVQKQHALIFEDLFQALKTLCLASPINHQNNSSNTDLLHGAKTSLRLSRNGLNGHLSETKNPEPEHLFLMWLISEARLLRYPEMQLNTAENQRYILIGHKLNASNIFDDYIDLFHVCSCLWSLLKNSESNLKDAVQNSFGLLRKEDDDLHRHLWRLGLFSDPLIDEHCSNLFCEIFPESAIETIIDKLFAESFDILSYVIVALLCTLYNPLMKAKSMESVRNALYMLRKEEADRTILKALDLFHHRK